MADYILREDAIQCAEDIADDLFGEGFDCTSNGARIVAEWLKDFPAADVQPVVRGHWIKRKSWDKYVCSECSNEEKAVRNFCPNCGADMRPEPPKESYNG